MTYSIVARDPETGHMGVAAQSQAFAVGSSVPWAVPGSGAVATQSMMVAAYEATGGPLEGRLLAALQAAEAEGGDLRGRRSVAMLVVRAERSGRPWQDQLVDLRGDDHPEPLEELERMLHYAWRYRRTAEAFELALDGHGDQALDRLEQAAFDPDTDVEVEPELVLWRAIALGAADRVDEARSLFAHLDEVAPAFVESARRFGPVRLVDPGLLERLLPPTAGR